MNISLAFIRIFFFMMCVLFFTAYTTTVAGFTLANIVIGMVSGFVFGLFLASMEAIFKKFNLRNFNIATLGLFSGYLMGLALNSIMLNVLPLTQITLSAEVISLISLSIFLFTAYLGMIMAARAADEIYISIPFIKFKPTSHKKKDILTDVSVLMDPRVVDLAASGLLDNNLVIPRFIIKELNGLLECTDETQKSKARRCLDTVKKFESMSGLEVRYADNDFSELKDTQTKLLKLARLLDANVLTADMSRLQQADSVKFINIHLLANALKPVTQSGESIHIKIQRYGKEPRQGVGYLEDGTMVVVNGGAEYIGDTIKAQVLSVKTTSSGRMIFCNALENEMMELDDLDHEHTEAEAESSHKNYFAI